MAGSNLHTPSLAATSTARERVSPDALRKAVNALLKWKKKQTPNPHQDDFIYLLLTLKKIPPSKDANPHKIPLPHPLLQQHSASSDFCLIIHDRLTSEAAQKKIKSEEIPIAKVVKLSKLKSDYRTFEAKRKLRDSYDLFLADKRVFPLLPKLLGKQFYQKQKTKIPVPVDLTHSNWKEQIETACSSALLCLSAGTCSVVRVGKVSMESRLIVENVVAAIDGVVEVVLKKWAGVRSFHLKFSESLALPIYQTLPDNMKLKIEGGMIKEGGGGELEVKDDKFVNKKGMKRGRIQDVRHMDA